MVPLFSMLLFFSLLVLLPPLNVNRFQDAYAAMLQKSPGIEVMMGAILQAARCRRFGEGFKYPGAAEQGKGVVFFFSVALPPSLPLSLSLSLSFSVILWVFAWLEKP